MTTKPKGGGGKGLSGPDIDKTSIFSMDPDH